jgi:hypothetical protein
MAISDGTILAAETQERIARSRAQTYRLQADHALRVADRSHYLHLARLQDAIAETQRLIIESLREFRLHAQMKQSEKDRP